MCGIMLRVFDKQNWKVLELVEDRYCLKSELTTL